MIASLRRRASAPNASRSSRSRSRATASSEASAGSSCCWMPKRALLALRCVHGRDGAAVDREWMRCLVGASTARLLPEDDAHRRNADDIGRTLLDAGELLLEPSSTQQLGGDVGEQRGFSLALLGLVRPAPSARCEAADDDGGCQVHGEREPVPAVGQRQGVRRRQEEEVEREHARHRDRHRVQPSPGDGDRQDREHVEHAEAQDGDVRLEEPDRRRDDRNGGDARGHTAERTPERGRGPQARQGGTRRAARRTCRRPLERHRSIIARPVRGCSPAPGGRARALSAGCAPAESASPHPSMCQPWIEAMMGMIRIATMFAILIIGLIAGPAVSL